MSEKYDVVIVGSGIGGLVCGCYLAKNGLKTLIVERLDKAGGYCTSFKRDGFNFDIGVHYLGGLKNGVLGSIFHDLQLHKKLKIYQFDPTDKIITPHHQIYIRKDPQNTIEEFKKTFPKEKENIDTFFDFVLQKSLPVLYLRTKNLTFKNLLDAFFREIGIKTVLSLLSANLGTNSNIVSATSMVALLREFILDPGYYPKGGMQAFSNVLAEQFNNYGGKIELGVEATKIITKNNSVREVILGNNSSVKTNAVVSDIDANETFGKLLGKKRITVKLSPSLSVFILYLGLKPNVKPKERVTIWSASTYDIDKFFPDSEVKFIKNNFSLFMITFPSLHDLSIKNKNTMAVFSLAPYGTKSFWNKKRGDLKKKLLSKVKKLTQLKENDIKLIFSATPHTLKRYTMNHSGAICGWSSDLKNSLKTPISQKTEIDGLFIAGHWATVGIGGKGIPGVASLGKNAAILAKDFLKK